MTEKERQDRSQVYQSRNIAWGTGLGATTEIPHGVSVHGKVIIHNGTAMKNFIGRDYEEINF